ncbi:zinc finger protein 583-like [Ctenocephalides felis]|uniref:zinc finger protein 583-like n=1 Tax=Ctenocephalides felis TaxID=7515 RepID=UPI000E6E3633|nr:zinc finger protein 583-like [Ctenocephalides felis]
MLPLFENVCRACLCNNECDMKTLLDDKLSYIYSLTTSIELNENDGLPHKVCKKCVAQLESVLEFREQCIRNDVTLRQQVINVKQEIPDYPLELKLEEPEANLDSNNISDDSADDREEYDPSYEVKKQPKKRLRKSVCKKTNTRYKAREKFKLECHICSRKMKTNLGLEAHLRKHEGKKPYYCATCIESLIRCPD